MSMVRVAFVVPPEFVAEIATVAVPAAVGVPLIAPLAASTLKPAGSPVAVKFVGELLALSVWLNGAPTIPRAAAALEITGGSGAVGFATVMVSVAFAVPPEFIAEIGTLKTPATVGVPEIVPLTVFKVRPAGRFDAA